MASVQSALQEKLSPGQVSTRWVDLRENAVDMWPLGLLQDRQGRARKQPQCVVWPQNTADIEAVVRWCNAENVPVVPYGAGSGVVGGGWAEGVTIDLKRMRHVTRMDHDALVCEAQGGILGIHLENHLRRHNLTLGHFPSSIICSTLGGWLAGRSAGQFSSRYGKIEDMVQSAHFVDGRGDTHTLASDPLPGPGSDKLALAVGSEGTLGIFADAKLRVWPKPEAEHYWGFEVHGVEHGLSVMRKLLHQGYAPTVMRLYDEFDSLVAKSKTPAKHKVPSRVMTQLKRRSLAFALLNTKAMRFAVDRLPPRCKLILGCEGDARLARNMMEGMREYAAKLGAKDLGAGPGQAWYHGRYHVSYKQSPMYLAGAWVDTMEVSAPWTHVNQIYDAVCHSLDDRVFVMAHFSHAYLDGCAVYFTFAGYNETDDVEHYVSTWRQALSTVVANGGSVSHHHGVGVAKAEFLQAHHGPLWSEFHKLKKQWDPNDIMNRGKW